MFFSVMIPYVMQSEKLQEPEKENVVEKDHDTEVITNPYVLAESEEADDSYIDETLFLGDSNTVRFMSIAEKTGKENTIAVVGMGVQAITSLPCMQFSTGTFSMKDSVPILQPRRVIITFGTNNLSGTDTIETREQFVKDYSAAIEAIEEVYPQTDIIVNSIPPIAETTVYKNLDPLEIKHWNEAIKQMCEDHHWYYLNSFEVLADEETGWAKEGMNAEFDGLHLSEKGIDTLFQYIKTHVLMTEDRRGTLNPIPQIIGPVTDVYKVDPISGNAFNQDEIVNEMPKEEPEVTEPSEKVPDTEPVDEPVNEGAQTEEPAVQESEAEEN